MYKFYILNVVRSQVGMDAGLFHPCFFAFLVISISIFNIFKYYFYTSFCGFHFMDFDNVLKFI